MTRVWSRVLDLMTVLPIGGGCGGNERVEISDDSQRIRLKGEPESSVVLVSMECQRFTFLRGVRRKWKRALQKCGWVS